MRLRWSEAACALPIADSGQVVFSSLLGRPVVLSGGSLNDLAPGALDKRIGNSRFVRLAGEPPFEPGSALADRLRDLGHLTVENQVTTEAKALREKRDRYLDELRRSPMLNRLGLTLTSACNFGCDYCIRESADRDLEEAALSQAQPVTLSAKPAPSEQPGAGGMTFAVAQQAVDALKEGADPSIPVSVGFSGGEPLLRWRLITEVVAYAEAQFGERVSFGLNTNASLITSEIAAFLSDHRFKVSVSLDGPKGLNGAARPFRNGGGETYDVIVAGLREMLDAGVDVQGLYATIVEANREALDHSFVELVADLGISTLTLEPDLVHASSFDPLWLAERLAELVVQGRSAGVMVTGYWRRAFDQLFEDVAGNPVQTFCGASSGEGINVTPDGAVQNCGFSAVKMGHVSDVRTVLEGAQFQDFVESSYAGSIAECSGCAIEGLCGGGCALTRLAATRPTREEVFRNHCSLYREVTARLVEATFAESQAQ